MEYTLRAKATVAADPDDVFRLITDLERLPDWNLEIPSVLETPPAVEVGAEWVVRIRAVGTHWDSRSTVTELDPVRRRFSYRSRTDDRNPSHALWRWRIDAAAGGGSEVAVEVDVRPRTFWRRWLLARVRRRSLLAAMHSSLEAIRTETALTAADHGGAPS